MPRPRGVEALMLGVVVASCSLDEFGDANPVGPDASSTGGVFTGGNSGFGGFPEASTGGTGGSSDANTGGVSATGGIAGSDSGTDGGGVDGGGGTGGAPVWTPKKIANCVIWLDADDASTLNVSGTSVTEWTSKCGATSVTAAVPKAPQHVIVGGKPVVQCNGTSDELLFKGTPVQATSYTAFFVIDKNVVDEEMPLWSNRNLAPPPSGSVTYLGHNMHNNLYLYQDKASTKVLRTVGLAVPTSTPMLFELAVTPSKRELAHNGTVEGSDTATSTATTLAGTLCFDLPKNEYGSYNLREIIAYDRALVEAERDKVRTELKLKWGF